MATTALKMAATCMLVLTMGQLMAAAVGASAPLVQGDAAPTARRLLAADHERPVSDGSDDKAALMLLQLLQKTKDICPCTMFTLECCNNSQKAMMPSLQLLKKTGSNDDCLCTPISLPCCV